MQIDVLAIGSRGDVQPYAALGAGLQRAGHRVRIVTLGGFEELVRSQGLDHLSIGERPQVIAQSESGKQWVKNRESTTGFLRGFARVASDLIEEGARQYWPAVQGTDLLLSSPMGLLVGLHVAEALQIPLLQAYLSPPTLGTVYGWDGSRTAATWIRGQWNGFAGSAFRFVLWNSLRGSMNAARTKILNLPPLPWSSSLMAMSGIDRPILCGYSPTVAPRLPDWKGSFAVTGYWFLDGPSDWQPPPELLSFLSAGEPPVFIGFGSTPFPEPAASTSIIVRAVAQSGTRAVLVSGGSGLATGQLSSEVLSIDSVPHDWLFSRVSAAVHQGGAGVTGAALRAGLPSVVVPIFADQPFWGSRVFELGAGPRPIPAKQLNENNLAAAIRSTKNENMRRCAAEIGERIRKEDGTSRAVEVIQAFAAGEKIPFLPDAAIQDNACR